MNKEILQKIHYIINISVSLVSSRFLVIFDYTLTGERHKLCYYQKHVNCKKKHRQFMSVAILCSNDMLECIYGMYKV